MKTTPEERKRWYGNGEGWETAWHLSQCDARHLLDDLEEVVEENKELRCLLVCRAHGARVPLGEAAQ